MRALEQLGFAKASPIGEDQLNHFSETTGFTLPTDYVRFLEYKPAPKQVFGFDFIHAQTGERWEGQVVEFIGYYADHLDRLGDSLIKVADRVLLPISRDAGGNYAYLDLKPPHHAVFDQDYQTGTLSEIAPSFGAFIDKLCPIE